MGNCKYFFVGPLSFDIMYYQPLIFLPFPVLHLTHPDFVDISAPDVSQEGHDHIHKFLGGPSQYIVGYVYILPKLWDPSCI